jgi:dipeptidyl-peptidase-4
MKKIVLLALTLLCSLYLSAQHTKNVSLEDIWLNYSFYPKLVDERVPMNDGESYLILEDDYSISQYKYIKEDKGLPFVSIDMLKPSGAAYPVKIDEFALSADEKKVLIKSETERIYRHSDVASFYVLNLASKEITPINVDKKQRLADFSPDGTKVAYIIDNNLFYKDLVSGKEYQITQDGKINSIINGSTDWVYEEEFSFTKGFFWSPDSKSIAFLRFDESNVKEYQMTNYGDLYPEPYKYKYPVAGEDNSVVSVMVYDLAKNQSNTMDVGNEKDQYIPRITWTKNAQTLAIFRMNRLQNKLEILLTNSSSGKSSVMLTQQNNFYIEITDDFEFCEDGKHFIIMSELDGYNHLYRYDLSGKITNQITKGNWDVANIAGIDDKNEIIYYISSESKPYNRDLYSIKFDGTNKTKLFSQEGTYSATFSKKFNYYFCTFSDGNTPPVTTINSNKGKVIRTVEANTDLLEKTKEYGFTSKEFFNFKTEGNIDLFGYMIKPKDFDKNKKYPLLMNVYGGPNSQYATNDWDTFDFIWYQMLAQHGYIVVCVDGRGTGYRGEQFRKCTYMQLGKIETEDQIETAKYLGHLSYVDSSRIGIWGWSYGGFMTALCMTQGANYFKAGIAVAPVTNWRNYDNIYTERYMRTPQENPQGYDDNSPVKYVKKLKGKFLLAHGLSDDNVHVQNSMELITALIQANKQFDMQLYPNKNHGIYGGNTRYHLYKKMTDFIYENL